MKPGIFIAALLAPLAVFAQTTIRYDWLTQGMVSGEFVLAIDDSGERRAHFEFNDRGRGPKLEERYRVNDAGLIRQYEVRGKAYMGAPVDERFAFESGAARWQSTLETGLAEGPLRAFYLANDGTPEQIAALARALLATLDRSLPLWPSGTARIEKAASESITHDGRRADVDLYAISGLGFGPSYVWLDDQRELFALSMSWMGLAPKGRGEVLPRLAARQQAAEQAHWQELASRLTHAMPEAICLKDFAVLDVDAGRLMSGHTVRIEDGVIAAAGADDAIDCRGVASIGGGGRTLMPGLWDMHVHIDIADGPLHIAAGVTTVRDLANDHDELMDAIGQFDKGTAIGPHVHRAGFIDARGPYSAPTGNLAETLKEALRLIETIDAQGYPQVKIYSSIPTAWVAPMAAEIHRRGLRLSGHIPTGMSAADAVRSGYDEIQHINMLFLNFLAGPGDDTRTPLRFSLVAERAASLDLDSNAVQEFIALLDASDTVIDPTMAIFDNMFRHRSGAISPSYAAIADHLPPNVRRSMLAGEMDIGDSNTERYMASAGALLAMIRKLHEAGVPLVAGTDALAGFTLHRELELYVEAGIPNADVLHLATIGATRVAGAADPTGRIAPGYIADLIALEGNPLDDISAVRNVAMTLKGKRLYRPDEVYRALGIEPFVASVTLPQTSK